MEAVSGRLRCATVVRRPYAFNWAISLLCKVGSILNSSIAFRMAAFWSEAITGPR
jgi:hypothetical protein